MLLNMKEILETAKEHNFAIPAFNIGTGQILNGVMDTCDPSQRVGIPGRELHKDVY